MPALSRVKRSRPLLGTFVTITVEDPRPEAAVQAIVDMAFGRLARVGSLMNFHDTASEVARLNACGHAHPLQVHEWTREVIQRAVALGHESEGAFDIAVEPGRQRNGFLARQPGQPAAAGTFRDIHVMDDGRVHFRRPLQIDLGGVARGFAVDKAVEFLRAEGVRDARVEAGGDVHVLGRPGDEAPLLHLRDPRAAADQFLTVPLRGPAVATTPAYLTNRRQRILRVSPLLHPRTGRPLRSNVSVSVFAASCTTADALARVVLVGEQQSWQPLLRRHAASATVVTARGEVVHFRA